LRRELSAVTDIRNEDRNAGEGVSDLEILIAKINAKRGWLVIIIIASTAMFATAAFLIAPVYRATTVLISASDERNSISGSLSSALGQLGGLAALAGVTTGSSDAATQEALAVLRSRQFTEAFIVEMNLVPELVVETREPADDTSARRPLSRALRTFSGIRTVALDNRTGLITLQVDWRDPETAARWANELARRLNSEMRKRAIEKADASLKFLQAELDATATVETREAINRLIEAQIRQRMLANVTQEYAFRVVDRAMAPDKEDPVRPNKALLVVLGPLVGFVVGVVLVLGYDLFARPRRGASR
jgi:uncharacterized protein involved in exopolysaccharide biosynthesis